MSTSHTPEEEAAARLIAAAPELLAVCQDILAWWRLPDARDIDIIEAEMNAMEQRLERAIANATQPNQTEKP